MFLQNSQRKIEEEFLIVDVFGTPDNPGCKRCSSVIEPLKQFVAGRLAGLRLL